MEKLKETSPISAFFIGYPLLYIPIQSTGKTLVPNLALVVDSYYEGIRIFQILEKCELVKEMRNLKRACKLCRNYQGRLHVVKKKDPVDALEMFAEMEDRLSLLIISGIFPKEMETLLYLVRMEGPFFIEETVQQEFFDWVIYHEVTVENIMELIETSKWKTTFPEGEWEFVKAMILVGMVWGAFFRAKGMMESAVEMWLERYVCWTRKCLNDRERLTGSYQVVETICDLLMRYVRQNAKQLQCYELKAARGLTAEEVESITNIFYDEDYFYVNEGLFRTICSPLLHTVSLPILKNELVEEGALVIHNLKTTGFTMKRSVYTESGHMVELRLMKLKKVFFMCEGYDIEDYIQTFKGGNEDD